VDQKWPLGDTYFKALGFVDLREMVIIALREKWYVHGGLSLTLQSGSNHHHKYVFIIMRSTPRTGSVSVIKMR
jgi:hypothetical protein